MASTTQTSAAQTPPESVPAAEASAAEQSNQKTATHAENATVPVPQPVPAEQTAMLNTQKPQIAPTPALATAEQAVTPQTELTAENQQKPKRTALFSFGRKQKEELPASPSPESGEQNSSSQKPAPTATTPQTEQKSDPHNNNKNENQISQSASGTPQQLPERDSTSQKKGSLARLFGRSNSERQDKPETGNTKTALVPLPKKDPHEYNDVLPGVRPNGGIVIKHRTSLYDDTDIDANEIDSASYSLASVGLYGRSLPNGLKVARKDVEVSCLKPQLVAILKTIERRFGKPVIITSGYRSPAYNRQVNGAKRSMHMSCAAADIQVPNVNKWEVAKFARSLPGRGGVGTYCHQSIHVDVGPKRDWNWSCSAKNN